MPWNISHSFIKLHITLDFPWFSNTKFASQVMKKHVELLNFVSLQFFHPWGINKSEALACK